MSNRPETVEEIVKALWAVRERVCAYVGKPGHRCDCKYGVLDVEHKDLKMVSGEDGSGCPEVLTAIERLESLTPAEAARLEKRVHKRRA